MQIRLNERNVVELINKLNQLGFLGDGLLHTVNGREYVTPEHLRREIVDTVEQAGGRMSLVCCRTTGLTSMIQHGNRNVLGCRKVSNKRACAVLCILGQLVRL